MAESLKFYTVDEEYVDYLAPYAPHLFRNAKNGQRNSRKYIGVVLKVGAFTTLRRFQASRANTER